MVENDFNSICLRDVSGVGNSLFHGTQVIFDDAPKPGGYDGVFWTALSAAVAQCYIPKSGARSSLTIGFHDRRHAPRPVEGCTAYEICRSMGFEARVSSVDSAGRPTSWSYPAGAPSALEIAQHLYDNLGYLPLDPWGMELTGSPATLLESGQDVRFDLMIKTVAIGDSSAPGRSRIEVVPASYRQPGQLLIIDASTDDRFRLFDISHGEHTLQSPQYNKIQLFERLRSEGYDGVVVSDFCQSRNWGNVEHKSVGFFAHVIDRLSIERIPATNFDWPTQAGSLDITDTPEWEAYVASLDAAGDVTRQEQRPR